MAKTQRLEAIPYKSDDWAQALARIFWWPMAAMGVMAVLVGLIAAFVAGVDVGEFFNGGNADDLGRGQATAAWAAGTTFLGLAFILSAIAMVLVNIVRTMRDGGRDVQQSLGLRPLQLKKPLVGHLIPYVMMMGLMVVMGGFVLGIVRASLIGGVDAAGLADPTMLSGGDLADVGAANAIGTWFQALNLTGLATIFVSIVLALRTIIKSLNFTSQRLVEIVDEKQLTTT